MSLVRSRNSAHQESQLVSKRRNGDASIGDSKSILFEPVVSLQGQHQGAVLTARFNKTGSLIASGGVDKQLLLWKLPSHEEVQKSRGEDSDDESGLNYGAIQGHKSAITSLAWTLDDSIVVTSSADATVGFWDTTTGDRVRKCEGHELCINDISVCDTNETIALSCSDDGYACLWDSRYKYETSQYKTDYPLLSCCMSKDGNKIYFSGIDPTIYCYDSRKNTEPLWTERLHNTSVTSVSLSNGDSQDTLISRSMDNTIRYYDVRNFASKGTPRGKPYVYDGSVSGEEQLLIRSCFSNDNKYILSGSADKTTTAWNFMTRKMLAKWSGHLGTVIDVDCHPTENIALSTSTDGTIILKEFEL